MDRERLFQYAITHQALDRVFVRRTCATGMDYQTSGIPRELSRALVMPGSRAAASVVLGSRNDT